MLAYIFGVIIGVVIGLIVVYCIAKKFEEIAEMKGHEGKPYFWWTFWLGMVGMLMVIALPNRNTAYSSGTAGDNKMTKPAQNDAVEKFLATPQTNSSESSDMEKPKENTAVKEKTKVCPRCGQIQGAHRAKCWACGTSM